MPGNGANGRKRPVTITLVPHAELVSEVSHSLVSLEVPLIPAPAPSAIGRRASRPPRTVSGRSINPGDSQLHHGVFRTQRLDAFHQVASWPLLRADVDHE